MANGNHRRATRAVAVRRLPRTRRAVPEREPLAKLRPRRAVDVAQLVPAKASARAPHPRDYSIDRRPPPRLVGSAAPPPRARAHAKRAASRRALSRAHGHARTRARTCTHSNVSTDESASAGSATVHSCVRRRRWYAEPRQTPGEMPSTVPPQGVTSFSSPSFVACRYLPPPRSSRPRAARQRRARAELVRASKPAPSRRRQNAAPPPRRASLRSLVVDFRRLSSTSTPWRATRGGSGGRSHQRMSRRRRDMR